MPSIEDKIWVIALAFGALGILGVLHCFASGLRNGMKQHDLNVRVNELRNMQMQKVRDRGTTFGLPGNRGNRGNRGNAKKAA